MFNFKFPSFHRSPVAVATPKNGDIGVIHQLAAEFSDISKKDIKSWREAIESASDPKTPKWAPLQDLYQYLRTDAHFAAMLDIRRGLTESTRSFIRDSKTSKENPEKTKLIEREWIFDMMGDCVDHAVFGHTAIQIINPETGEYHLLPRRNFVPQKDLLLLEANGEKGIDVNDQAFKGTIIVIKSRDQFGIMNDIVPDLIWKKNARQAWATFSEKFGIPLVTATTTSRDKKELDRIETMLRALGKAAQAVFPQGTTLDIKDTATKGDPYNVFLKQMEYCDAQISKRMLGGTMISDDGSSKSQSEVHERTMNDIIAGRDRKKMEFVFNSKIIPVLRNVFKFPFTDTDEFVFDRSQSLGLTDQWKIVSEALDKGYEIDNDWISSTFNFPITGIKELLAPAPDPAKPTARNTPQALGSFFD